MAVYQRYISGCDLAVGMRPQASAVGNHAYCMVTGVILCFNCMSVQTHKKPHRSVFENPFVGTAFFLHGFKSMNSKFKCDSLTAEPKPH